MHLYRVVPRVNVTFHAIGVRQITGRAQENAPHMHQLAKRKVCKQHTDNTQKTQRTHREHMVQRTSLEAKIGVLEDEI